MSNDLEKLVAAEVQRQLAAVAADSTTKKVLNYLKQSGGHSLGDTWISFDSTVPAGGVPFCGQTVTRAMYGDLLTWATAQGKVKTESEWQSIASANGGNCPYYSSGDGSTNFRMPAVLGYFKGAASASEGGTYKAEGLPNIEGITSALRNNATIGFARSTGVFDCSPVRKNTEGLLGGTFNNVSSATGSIVETFDASRCSPIYGNSSQVTPETFTVLVGVYAGAYSNEGSIDVAGLQTAMAALETEVNAKPSPDAYVTESWRSGSDWYRKWSDGFIEQGGKTKALAPDERETVTFPLSFQSEILNKNIQRETNTGNHTPSFNETTMTGATLCNNTSGGSTTNLVWYVSGY